MRARGEGSLYQRSDGRWVAAITAADGRRISRYAANRADGARLLARLRRERDAGATRLSGQTVEAYLRGWLRAVEPSLRPATWRSHEQHLRVHVVPALGSKKLDKLTVAEVDAFLASLRLSSRSVSHVRASLRRALADAVREGLVSRNVAALSKPVRVPEQQAQAWTAEQLRLFLQDATEDRLYPLWVVAASTGMRQAELLGLPWDNVQGSTIVVDRTLVRHNGTWRFAETKTARSRRVIPLNPAAVSVLRAWRAKQLEERLANPPYPYHGLVFTTDTGYPIHGSNLLPPLYRAQDRAGVPRLPFHGLRHTFASVLLARGTSPRVVMELLGHSTIRVTMDVYAHVAPEDTRKAAEALGDLF